MGTNRALRLMFALFMIPTGAVLVLIAGAGKVGALVSGLGLSLIVAGIVAAFRELAIVPFESNDTANQVAARLKDDLFLNEASGITRIEAVRRGFDGYYKWVISLESCDLFFAGRSVLHRIQEDLNKRETQPVERVILNKLKQNSKVRILFLDPRSDLIPRLAREEGQTADRMLNDLATSLGICRRLHELIEASQDPLPPAAELHIRVYDEVPHVAYHRHNDEVIIGFYFLPSLGSQSGAFELTNAQNKKIFADHFALLFDRASTAGCIIERTSNREESIFNENLYAELRKVLVSKLGEATCDVLMGADHKSGRG